MGNYADPSHGEDVEIALGPDVIWTNSHKMYRKLKKRKYRRECCIIEKQNLPLRNRTQDNPPEVWQMIHSNLRVASSLAVPWGLDWEQRMMEVLNCSLSDHGARVVKMELLKEHNQPLYSVITRWQGTEDIQ
ncbi:hypothetical protein PAMP_003483 [Pampus punctatissimus]